MHEVMEKESIRKDLVIIADDYPSLGRPVYTFIEQLAIALTEQGINIVIIAPQSITKSLFRSTPLRPVLSLQETPSGKSIHIFRPKYITTGKYFQKFQHFVSRFKKKGIERVLNSFTSKNYILYGHFWHNAIIVSDYAERNNVPLFVACGEGDDAMEVLAENMPLTERYRISKNITGVISVSSENKRKSIDYKLINEDDVIVLPNSVNQTKFHKKIKKASREKIGLDDSDFVVVFVGAFIYRKGSQRLAEAISLINDDSIKTLFIGQPFPGDDYTPNCKGIHFMGVVEHNLLPDYLGAADIFVLPTLKEGCSNAIVEALACGLPVISSNLPFNDDILDENNSIKIDPLNVKEIAEAILLLKNNEQLRLNLSESALIRSKDLSIETRAKKIIEFIRYQINKSH